VIKIKFSPPDCSTCPSLHLCTRSKKATHHHTPSRAAVQSVAICSTTSNDSDYQADYARRAGIEGTLSGRCGAHGLHRARYIGLANPSTTSNHSNSNKFKRIFHWLSGVPQTTTRTSQFARLMAQSVSYAIFRHQYQKWIRADNGAILRIVDI